MASVNKPVRLLLRGASQEPSDYALSHGGCARYQMRTNAPGLPEVSKGSDAAFLTPRGLLQSHGQPGSNHCCKQGSDRHRNRTFQNPSRNGARKRLVLSARLAQPRSSRKTCFWNKTHSECKWHGSLESVMLSSNPSSPNLASARSGLSAAWELERCDPRMKIETPVRRDVLIDIPERAVVRRVDGHTAVVTPAVSASCRSACL